MISSTAIQLRAEGRKRFQAGDERFAKYKSMPLPEIQALIEMGDALPSKKTVNGTKPRKTAESIVKAATTKTTSTAPAAKLPRPKPVTRTAARGEAKRPASVEDAAAKLAARTPAKSAPEKTTPVKGKKAATKGAADTFRAPLDREKIDWSAKSAVGKRKGVRSTVLKLLRKYKGDFEKVYKELLPDIDTLYADVTTDRKAHLKWHIGKTAFDFAMDTGQHTPGNRKVDSKSAKVKPVRKRKPVVDKPVKREEKTTARKNLTTGKKVATTQGTKKTPARSTSDWV